MIVTCYCPCLVPFLFGIPTYYISYFTFNDLFHELMWIHGSLATWTNLYACASRRCIPRPCSVATRASNLRYAHVHACLSYKVLMTKMVPYKTEISAKTWILSCKGTKHKKDHALKLRPFRVKIMVCKSFKLAVGNLLNMEPENRSLANFRIYNPGDIF